MVFQGIDPGTIWDGSSGDLELIRNRSGDVLEMFLEFCGVSSARRCAALPLIPRGAALEPFTVARKHSGTQQALLFDPRLGKDMWVNSN